MCPDSRELLDCLKTLNRGKCLGFFCYRRICFGVFFLQWGKSAGDTASLDTVWPN